MNGEWQRLGRLTLDTGGAAWAATHAALPAVEPLDDDRPVVVYQAYRAEIADYAVSHQQLGGPAFSYARIKANR